MGASFHHRQRTTSMRRAWAQLRIGVWFTQMTNTSLGISQSACGPTSPSSSYWTKGQCLIGWLDWLDFQVYSSFRIQTLLSLFFYYVFWILSLYFSLSFYFDGFFVLSFTFVFMLQIKNSIQKLSLSRLRVSGKVELKVSHESFFGSAATTWIGSGYFTCSKSGTAEEKSNATAKALDMSLQYSFVTPLTSMLVTRPEDVSDGPLIADKLTEGTAGWRGPKKRMPQWNRTMAPDL